MKTVLFSFENDEARDQFLIVVKGSAATNSAAEEELIQSALNTVKLDPPIKEDHERMVSIFVTGEKLYEGQMAEMNKVFNQESASHTGSVVMKELRGGEWVEIRARRKAI